MIVKVEDAKVHLESLLRRVTNGEEITITDNGIAVARLIPVVESKTNREFGIDEGKVWISEDFDAPSPEIEAMFTGSTKPRRKSQSE